jgi:hypothetical protein
VTRTVRPSHGLSRCAFLTLAILALAFKIVVPPGFMAARPTNDLPFAIVLCTGQGTVTVNTGEALPTHGDSEAPAKSNHESPCAFAGQGVSAPPPALQAIGKVEFVAFAPFAVRTPPSLAPGRGLAAPPLPARGPPSLLI